MGRASSRKLHRHERPAGPPGPNSGGRPSRIWLQVAVAAVVVGAAVGLVLWLRPSLPKVVVPTSDPFRGPAAAPVVLTEFSDFQCPSCRAVEPVLTQVLAAYPTQVKLVYVNYPLPMHQFAERAAVAALCANEQGKFWELHDRLFDLQPEWAASADVLPLFHGYAVALGLDHDRFDACLASGRMLPMLREDIGRGTALKIEGTPTIFVNERRVAVGAGFDDLKRMIDDALRGAS
ncbi:MAG TPA: DsbA family protein [Nitrospiria bacterium]|nr:DsbA family protein [Nitrospiria bacterium]